jgi:hypothetical protein
MTGDDLAWMSKLKGAMEESFLGKERGMQGAGGLQSAAPALFDARIGEAGRCMHIVEL